MVDEFIHRPTAEEGDTRPAILAMKIANKIKGYEIILKNIDHYSSEKFTQLQIELPDE